MSYPVAILESRWAEGPFAGLLLDETTPESAQTPDFGSVFVLRILRSVYKEVYGARDPEAACGEVIDKLRKIAGTALDGELVIDVREFNPYGCGDGEDVYASWTMRIRPVILADEGKEIIVLDGEPYAEVFRALPRAE
ncbi:MAG: hypothetical protein WAP74_04020 [Patescibacteria group bacterium]